MCAMVLAHGEQEVAHTEGRLEGWIAEEPRGSQGFGYDPIFFVPELKCHLAEVDQGVKNSLSHRGRALQAMLPLLVKHLKETQS
jgi:XTP/dITP diphosphohydrolase